MRVPALKSKQKAKNQNQKYVYKAIVKSRSKPLVADFTRYGSKITSSLSGIVIRGTHKMAENFSPERADFNQLADTPIGAGPGTTLLPIIPLANPAIPHPTPRRSKPPGLPRDTILTDYADTVSRLRDEYNKGGNDEEVIESAREEIKRINRDLGYMQRHNARKMDITALRTIRNELNSFIKNASTVDQSESLVGLERLYTDEPEPSIQNSLSHNNDSQPSNEAGLDSKLQALELLVEEKVGEVNSRMDKQDKRIENLHARTKMQEEIKARNARSIEEYQQVPLDIIQIKESMSTFKKEIIRLETSVLNLGETVSELSEENSRLRDNLAKVRADSSRVRHSTGLDDLTTEEVKEQAQCLEDTMWILIGSIESTIGQPVEISSDPMYLKDIYRNDMPRLDKQASDLKTDLNRYIRLPGHDTRVKDKIIVILKKAERWKQELKTIWNKKEIFSVVPSSKETLADVGQFHGNGEMVIFDFLRKFDNYFNGTRIQKVDRLFNNHLSETIRNSIPHLSDDLEGLRQYLVAEFGQPDKMIHAIVSELEKKKSGPTPSIKQRFTVLTAISSTMTRLLNLKKHVEVDPVEVERFLSTNQFLSRLIKLLPTTDRLVFMRDIADKGLDARHVKGITTFDALAAFVRTSADALEEMAKEQEDESKVKAVHSVCNHSMEFNTKEGEGLVGGDKAPTNRPRPDTKPTNVKRLVWGGENLRFPCPLNDHSHELRNCPVFFALAPKERRDVIPYNRICKLCLKPRYKCEEQQGSRCGESIPPVLRCWGCEKMYKSRKTPPRFNVLYCFDPTHEKPTQEALRHGLAEYLGPLSDVVKNKQIVVAACFSQPIQMCANACVHDPCKTFQITKTSPPQYRLNYPSYRHTHREKGRDSQGMY